MLIRRTPTVFERVANDWNRSLNEVAEKGYRLALDVHENDEAYVITTAIPGVNADDIDIRLQDNVLQVSAEIRYEHDEESDNTLLRERRYGKFSRSLRFPVPVNNEVVEADYVDGVLTITVPKAEEVKPYRITVNAARNN